MSMKDKVSAGVTATGMALLGAGALYMGYKIVTDGELSLGPVSVIASPVLHHLKEEAGQADFLASMVEGLMSK